MEKAILHADLNNFFASVECLARPEIAALPVAVCGRAEERHGIVLAKNEHAKKFGITTGEPVWQAKKKCSHLLTVPPTFKQYMKYSQKVRNIYLQYTDLVEPYGIDECYLDVTGSRRLFGNAAVIAEELRKRVRAETGLTISVGVSFNKVFAKLGSDMKKPDAVTVISRDEYKEKIWPLDIRELLFVGRSTQNRLKNVGINTIGTLAQTDPGIMRQLLGKHGDTLWQFANGLDHSPVLCEGTVIPAKSVGNSTTTIKDLENDEDVWPVFYELAQSVCTRLREGAMKTSLVQIYIRDNKLFSEEHQARLEFPCSVTGILAEKAMEIFQKHWNWRTPVRSIGLRACEIVAASAPIQVSFYSDIGRLEKMETLEKSVDTIRSRFGKHAITVAALLGKTTHVKMPSVFSATDILHTS